MIDRPHQGEDLGALARFGALRREPLRPHIDDFRHIGPGLHVVDNRRGAEQPLLGRIRRPRHGLADATHDGSHERRFFPAHKGPGPLVDLQVETELGAQDVFPQETKLPGLGNGLAQTFDRQGIFVTHVNVTRLRPDGISPDDHALDDRMRVAFHDRPIHKGPGVAFVAVANDKLDLAFALTAQPPFAPGEKSGPAPASQAGTLHGVDNFFRGHLEQNLAQRPIAPHDQVIIQALGIDDIQFPQHQRVLGLVEGNLGFVHALLPAHRVFMQKALHHPAVYHRGVNNLRHILRGDPLIADLLRADEDAHALRTQAMTPRAL